MLEKQDLENNLNSVHEWIKAADQKISIFAAFQALIIAAFVQKITESVLAGLSRLSIWDVFALVAFAACIISSFGKALIALIPRLKNDSDEKSVLYFGDIGKMSMQEYRLMIDGLDDSKYRSALVEQIHTCSVIATKKHQQLRWSIILFIIGVIIGSGEYIFLTLRS